jgi:hypothetical protein
MPTQSSNTPSTANLTGTVLDNLQPGSPLQPQISAELNAALKTQLAAAATAANLPALVGLINVMPAADFVAAKDLSLQAFAQQQIDPMVSGDPAMKTAIDTEISKLPATGTISTALNLTSPLAAHPLLKGIVADAQLTSLLATSPAITSAMQARFVTLYNANTGAMTDFWTQLASDPQLGPVVPQLQLTLQLGTLTQNNTDLVAKLQAQFHPASLRDLTKLSTDQLVQLMTAENVQVPAAIAAMTTPATIAQYADSIVGSLKQAFPTDYVAKSFSASTDLANQAVAAFVTKSPDFDFATTHIDQYLASNPSALAGLSTDQVAALTDRLKAAQRVFRVITDGDVMQTLIENDLDSSYKIATTPGGSFLAQYADGLGGEAQAQQIYANATNIMGVTSMVIRTAQENSSGLMSKVIATGGDTGPLDQNLPNWQTLFGTTSTCQCTECQAIDGPAAYFVSLLEFLRKLPENGDRNTPLDVLIGNDNSGHLTYRPKGSAKPINIEKIVKIPRRPDLAYLKLNCANADTALPYVDLVNEILENYVHNSHIANNVMTSEVTSAAAHNTPLDATTAVLDVTPEYMQTRDAGQAYDKLNAESIVYPYSLPFDRYLETVRTYLNFLGVSLDQLMQTYGAFQGSNGNPLPPLPRATRLAAESLLISLPEYILIAGQDFSGNAPPPQSTLITLPNYFGYTGVVPRDLSWEANIAQVSVFLSRTGLAFGELVKLLETQYLNPQHLDPQKAVTLTLPKDPSKDLCDVTSMRIQNAGSAFPPLPLLPPLPAFIRLWRKLGWTISELDYALRAFGEVATVATGSTPPGLNIPIFPEPTPISPRFILIAAQIQQLTQALNLSVSDVVSLWKDIDTDGRASPFVTLFQNKAVVNPPDPALQLLYKVPLNALPDGKFLPAHWSDGTTQNQATYKLIPPQQLQFVGRMTDDQRDDLLLNWADKDDAAILAVQLLYSQRWYDGIDVAPTAVMQIPGRTELVPDWIGNHVNAILAALRISASDLMAIGQDAGLYDPTSTVTGSGWVQSLSVSNLSALYRYAILARSLGLSVPDLIALKNLTGLQPFALSSGAAGPQTDPMVKFVAAAQQVTASSFSVAQLAYLYGPIAGQTGSLAPLLSAQDALMATILSGLQNIAAANVFAPDPTGAALRKKLAVLIPSSQQLDATMGLIAGSAIYTTPLSALPAGLNLPANLPVSFVQTATIGTIAGATITAGDSVSLIITTGVAGAAPVPISYVVLATDTPETIANFFAAQINANPAVAGASVTVSGAVISLSAPPGVTWTRLVAPGSATETVTFGANLVSNGPLSDAAISALNALSGADATFSNALQDLSNQAQDVLTQNLGFLAAAGPTYSVQLAAIPSGPNLPPAQPFSFVLTATIGGTITATDTVSLAVTLGGAAASPLPFIYPVQTSDTPESIAAALASQINANQAIAAAGASVTVSGAVITLSTPSAVSWTEATTASAPATIATETVTLSGALVSNGPIYFVRTATIGGKITAMDSVSLTVTTGAANPAAGPFTYVVQATDTPQSIAAALASQINANQVAAAAGVSVTVSGAVITLSAPPSVSWTKATTPTTATETVTLSVALVSEGPMLNSTRTLPLWVTDTDLNNALKLLYDLAWNPPGATVSVIGNLIDVGPASTAADRYNYVLLGLLAYLTNSQSRNLVKQTLAQTLGMDPTVVEVLIDGNAGLGWPAGLLLSSIVPSQPSIIDPPLSAINDFLGGLSAAYTSPGLSPTTTIEIDPGVALDGTEPAFANAQWRGKLLPPKTAAYSFAVSVNNALSQAPTLLIGGQVVTLATGSSPVSTIKLTAGQLYDISLSYAGAPAGVPIVLQWCIAPAALSTLSTIPALAFMPCDKYGNYPTLALLYRIAVLVNGFSMSAAEIAYFSTNATDFEGTDPASGAMVAFSLPTLAAAADPPALFNQWQRLNAFYGLKSSLPVTNTPLIDVFSAAASSESPRTIVETVAAATGWNSTDLQTLAGSSSMSGAALTNVFNFTVPQFRDEIPLVQIAACLAICSKVGLSAQQLFNWANPAAAPAGASPYQQIAQDLQNTVKAKYDEAGWLQVGKPLNDKLRESSKDALIAFILYLIPNPAVYSTADDLYGFFLIDVEMCTCMETSRLVQASAAVQLFVQRCLLNLEPEVSPSAFGTDAVTEWRQWRKNYRVWQAAVEVFLYPENWIEPELRPNATPFFENLETKLLQGSVTKDNVEAAFLGYLESLQQVARLEIAGLYTDNDVEAGTQITHVIGRTFTTPHVYSYRTLDNRTFTWSPWEQISADISGDSLIPVVWNRRLFLFWPIYTEVSDPVANNPPSSTITTEPGQKNGQSTTSVPQSSSGQKALQIQMAWTEYKSGKWTPKQLTAEVLTPAIYGKYSIQLDQSSFIYKAVQNKDGLVIRVYSTNDDILGQAIEFSKQANQSIIELLAAGAKDNTNLGSTLNNNALQAVTVAQSTVVLLEPFLTSSQYNNTKIVGGEFPNMRDALQYLINLVKGAGINNLEPQILSALQLGMTSFGEILSQLSVNSVASLGSFFFDGSQGAAQITVSPATSQSLESAFGSIAYLYGLDHTFGGVTGDQKVSELSYQNMVLKDTIFQLVVLGAGVAGTQIPVPLLSGSSDILPAFTVSFPQQDLPLFSIDATQEPFQKVAFYADGRRTFFVINSPPPSVASILPESFYLFNHYHPWIGQFIKNLNWKGIPGLLEPTTQGLDDGFSSTYFSFGFQSVPKEIVDFGPSQKIMLAEYSKPNAPAGDFAYAEYNWEIFFYIPFIIATRLSQNQQFDDAETWFRYILDLTKDPKSNPPAGYVKGSPYCYWNFLPFNALGRDPQLASLLASVSGNPLLNAQLSAWQQTPFEPDVIARFRIVAYQKAVVMKYLDHLIRRGDYCFGQNTRESIYEAIQYYILADQILGKKPIVIPQPGIVLDQTYKDLLKDGINLLGNANVALENAFPFVVSGTVSKTGKPTGKGVLPSTPYFCTPDNPTLLGYYDTVADRLYKIRHCMNIEGQVEQLALFSPPINPGLLVAAEAAGVDLSSVLNDISAAVPHYRFSTMMAKALELCSEVRSLGAALLAAMEKYDGEGLALLRAGQEVAVQQAVLLIKQQQVQEANDNLAGLQATQAVTTARQGYYNGLVAGGLSGSELAQLIALATAEVFKIASQVIEATATGLALVPQVAVGINGAFGSPSVIVTFGGVQTSTAASSASRALSGLADLSSFVASMAGISGGWERRNAEWKFQAAIATLELTQIQQQINAANIRVQIATQDVTNQNLLIANASAVQDALKSKFTSQDLYGWMIGQVSAVFFQCYQMAYDLAKRAEACYRFELGIPQSSYIQFGSWDSLKQGLLSGEKLFQDLKRLEIAYLDQNLREYEISKSISLLLLDPSAFVSLKLTGQCLITLPEAFFDMDYPGHYMRRIRNVSLTIPCVTGPYTSVNCTLTLLQSKIRQTNAVPYAEKPVGSDTRFTYNFSATESIATSTAQNDSGLFEVNFRDERYLPFEGAGVVSQWQLSMPPDCNAFDFETITDLVINLRYTARNGGDALRKAAKAAAILPAGAVLPPASPSQAGVFPKQNNLQRYFSLRHEYPTEWYKLLNPPAATAGTPTPSSMQINLGNDRFPFQYRSFKIHITQAQFVIVFRGSSPPLSPSGLTLSNGSGTPQPPTPFPPRPPAIGNALLYTIPSPPPPTTVTGVQDGPNCWILQGDMSTLSDVADILLICTYSPTAT